MFTQKPHKLVHGFARWLLLLISLIGVILSIGLANTAHAATTITVNTLDGELNNDGDCALREAIEAANSDSARDACPAGNGADTINFSVNGIISLFDALPPIQEDLTLIGPGVEKLSITANDVVAMFRVEAGVTFALSDLVIGDGYAPEGSVLYNLGTVTLSNCVVDSARADTGAIFNTRPAHLTINHCSLVNSRATQSGGAIYNEGLLSIRDSTFSGNIADNGGGGAIFNRRGLTIRNSIFRHNTTTYDGGAILNVGGVNMFDSTFAANSAGRSGGGIYNEYELKINNSTFAGNSASEGGGIYVEGFSSNIVNIINSTFSGNQASYRGGALIDTYDNSPYVSPITIKNSTFIDNIATSTYTYRANSIFTYVGPTISNTIIASSAPGDNCHRFGNVIDGGHNLEAGNSCSFSADNSSLIDTNPKLRTMADNGGATQTHALQPDSPAIDAGDDIVCADPDTVNRLDQRGVVRPQGAQCDIGAYELVAEKEIKVLPASLQFPTELEGSNNPAPIFFSIDNARTNGVFAWSVRTDTAWLQASPAFGNTPATAQVQADISILPPGVHTANVIVTSPDLTVINRPFTVPVTIQIAARNSSIPILRVNQANLSFQTDVIAGNPTPLNFTVENLGGGVLNWQASVNNEAQAWLTLDHTSGVAPATVNAQVNIGGLTPGTYVGAITVGDAGAVSPPHTLSVILMLQAGPTLGLSTTKLVFVGRKDQANPPPQTLTIDNSGAGSFTWQATEDVDWLTLASTSGAAPASVNATANTSGLKVGVYRGQMTVSAPTAAGSPTTIDTVLGVLSGAILDVKPSLVTFDTVFGSNPSPGQIIVRNAGAGTLEWVASANVPWLSLAQSSGSIQGQNSSTTLQVNINSTTLSGGTYQGQITLTSPNGEASPQTVNVIVTVASPVKYCNLTSGRVNLLEGSRVKLYLENVNITNTATGCHIRGALRLNLPQNANLIATVEGDARLEGGQSIFNAEASAEIVLEIANLKLRLGKKNLVIRENLGLTLDTAGWDLPPLFGGGFQAFATKITIGLDGISIAGQRTFDLPNLKWGSFSITQNKGSVSFSSDGNYHIDVKGLVRIVIPGTGNATSTITLKLDKRGIRTGSVSSFTMAGFAGLDLSVQNAQVDSNRVVAKSASLKAPKAWGGLNVTIYDLKIETNGNVRIGGGSFNLPNIKAGGDAFQVSSLKGKLKSLPSGGYEIQASGMFGMSGLSNGRTCKLWVDITLQTGPANSSILTIQSVEGAQTVVSNDSLPTVTDSVQSDMAVDGLRLSAFTLGVHCRPGWPIATTGFFLTGVEGSIQLGTTVEQVAVKVWIESKAKVGNKPAISTIPKLTIHPKPFALDFNAPIYLVGFETYKTKVHIDERSFSGEVTFNYKVVRGGYGLAAGRDKADRFYLRGSGWAEIYVEKGALLQECIRYPSPTFSNPGRTRKACISVPDSSQHFGEARAAIDLEGIDVILRIAGYKAKARFDFSSGKLSVGRGLLTSMVTSAQIAEARQGWEASQRGEVVAAAIDERIAFAPDGGVLITMPVAHPMPMVQAADVITTYPFTLPMDAIFGLVQPPTGTLQLRLIDPAGQELNPTALPGNIQLQQSVNVSETQTIYFVTGAAVGNWQTKVVGDTTSQPFFVIHQINTPPPTLSDLSLATTGNANQVHASWRLLTVESGTYIKLYAQTAPLTTTVTYTDADGTLIVQTTPVFAGTLLAENLTPDLSGNIASQPLDLSQLPSGQYSFWIEAIGTQGGFTRCFVRQDSTSCDQTGLNPIKVNVDQGTSFPSQWTTTITTEIDSKRGELLVQWTPNSHPDVDNYILRLRTTEVLTPTAEIVNEYVVGPVDEVSGSTIVSNIEPGHTYHVSIGAQDLDSGRLVWSQEHVVTTPQPEFLISTAVANIQVVGGGVPVVVPILVDMASDLPYPVAFELDYERLPDGIYVNFDSEIIEVTTTQTQSIASISASDTLLAGDYVVPVLAHSGLLEHNLNIVIGVKSAETQINSNIYLPIISR